MGSGPDAEAWFPPWLGPLLLAAAFVGLAAWSWEKWADVQIDFGSELYIAWRLSEGDALYRDIAHRNGPLAHYVNAAWFALFGVSIRTLTLCNLAVLAAICGLTARIFRLACGRFTATAACLVLLFVFGFSQYVGIGNYNYVAPYHHHQTHGVLLSLGSLAALAEALRRAPRGWCALAGLCLGGVFLTKAELFVPAALAAALGLVLVTLRWPAGGRATAAFAAGAAVPPLAAFALLATAMPAGLALEGALGNWAHLGGVADDPFYLRGAGLDDVWGGLRALLLAAVGIGAFAAAALGLDRAARAVAGPPGLAAGAAGAAVFAALLAWSPPWFALARALPLVAGVTAALLCLHCVRRRALPRVLERQGPLAVYAVWATALLGKMLLHARFEHYGFALAMPATLLLVALLVHLLPGWLAQGRGAVARGAAVGAIAAGVVFFLDASHEVYRRKDFPVGVGADRILARSPYASPRGRLLAEAAERLEALASPDSTLLVLPEGAGLNYWLRLRNPSRFLLFLPTELASFGEATMLAELQARPPDFVALVHRRGDEFGVGPFGEDPRNGRRLMQWIAERYRRVARLGAEPFRSDAFGVVLLRRVDPEADAPSGGVLR